MLTRLGIKNELRVVRCKHFKRRFKERWEFGLSLNEGFVSVNGTLNPRSKPAVLIVKLIKRRIQIRALCERCAFGT